ncbi:hypothetical protein SFR_1746 [Streptomyces sp. FR-008]|nr:hypothetical protein SFR_1746 [Streptomyces sp. FR-008]
MGRLLGDRWDHWGAGRSRRDRREALDLGNGRPPRPATRRTASGTGGLNPATGPGGRVGGRRKIAREVERREGRGSGPAGIACSGRGGTPVIRWFQRDVRLLQS